MCKTSNPQKRRRSLQGVFRPTFIPNLAAGGTGIDLVSGVAPVTSISGTRYGLVNGVVTQFAVNQPPIEDDGLRGCPAFTSYWYPGDLGTDISHSIEDGWNKITLTANSGGSTFVRSYIATSAIGEVSILQAVIKKGTARYLGFRARRTSGTSEVDAVFDFNVGDFSTLNTHEKIFVKNIDVDTYHVCLRYVAPNTIGAFFGISLCQPYGTEVSTGQVIGQYAYFKSLTATIGNNITSFVIPNPSAPTSYVSEAATATTGTIFDLDNDLLARLKNRLRGAGVGSNLWGTPTKSTPPWSDDGTYYVCDGSVTSSSVSSAAVQTGKFYEIEFTTGAVTSGQLIVYVGAQIVFQAVPTANTTYRLRNAILTTSANVAFSSGAGFIGQVRKDIIVKEIKSQGHLDLTIKTNYDSGWWANSSVFNILSLKNAAVSLIYINKDAGGAVTFRTTDGTNVASVSQVLNVGSTYKIAVDWGIHSTGQKIMITVNGVKSALADFSGSFGAQDLTFFYGNTVHAGWIVKDSLKIFERPRW